MGANVVSERGWTRTMVEFLARTSSFPSFLMAVVTLPNVAWGNASRD